MNRKKIYVLVALAFSLVAVLGFTFANLWWNNNLPSGGITITTNFNANLYDNSALTQLTTGVNFASALDGLDTVSYTYSQIIYMKYVGSASATKNFIVRPIGTLPSDFSFFWSQNITGTTVWTSLNNLTYFSIPLAYGLVIQTQFKANQTTTHQAGTYPTGFVFSYEITD